MREGRPSTTALTIALAMVWLGRRGAAGNAALVSAEDARLLRERLGRLGMTALVGVWLATSAIGRPFVRLAERALTPGILTHFGLRKKMIADEARAAVREGCGRVVVVAAGLDLLGLRLAREFPSVRVFEVDHPATQQAKRALLRDAAPPANLALVPADLRSATVSAALANASGAGGAGERESGATPTLFIVEGLTMYLTETQVARLLEDLAGLAAPGSRLLCTFMEPGPTGRARFTTGTRLLRAWLRWKGESMDWGIGRDAAARFFASHGWETSRLYGAAEFDARMRAAGATTGAVGEFLVVAECST